MHSIQRDMVMLENQLPLFVLNRLLELQLGTRNQTGLVAQLAIRFFDPLMPTDEPLTKSGQSKLENSLARDKSFDPFADMGELHCLDVFRRSLLRSSPKPEPRLTRKRWSRNTRVADKRRQQLIHCVTELKEAGIKFRRRKTDRFWDIQFKNGYLEIPRLLIHDGTFTFFTFFFFLTHAPYVYNLFFFCLSKMLQFFFLIHHLFNSSNPYKLIFSRLYWFIWIDKEYISRNHDVLMWYVA